jgi:O-antigen/teichoic acid export membrane protein
MRRYAPDLLIILLLFALPLLAFWNQTVGGHTLLPADNLYQYAPYAALRAEAGVPDVPHNHLLSDMVLQNMGWKAFIRQQWAAGDFPLWNPHQFSGIAFFAAGQHSALYPFSILYYLLDLPAAYGWFMVVALWVAGVNMMLLARALGAGRAGGAIAGVTYQLAGFMLASAVFPMLVAGAAWLPLLLLAIEAVIRRAPIRGRAALLPWVALGALAIGCTMLAGHVEFVYYTLLVAGGWAALRLGGGLRAGARAALVSAAALLGMVALGGSIGAVQFAPLVEAAGGSFRAAGAPFEQVLGYAHPPRDVVQFVLPNFYGSPAQHEYFDIFALETVSLIDTPHVNADGARITHTEWGMKNYVEGALYVGILPLLLAAIAVWDALRRRDSSAPPYRALLIALAAISLSFMFGAPTYAVLYYAFPGIDQLHSPFRWVFPFTLAIAALAGLGAHGLLTRPPGALRRLGTVVIGAGALTLIGVLALRLGFDRLEGTIARLIDSLAKARDAFSDPAMFASVQAWNLAVLGVVLIASGLALHALARRWRGAALLAVLVIAADLIAATGDFNPSADPAWLEVTPPSIAWLRDQPRGRYITLDEPGKPALFNANLTQRYGLDDVRGYESIIPAHYVNMMRAIHPQDQLQFNRVSPLFPYGLDAVDWERLALLNTRYLIVHADADPSLIARTPADPEPLYADSSVRIHALPAYPRAFMTAHGDSLPVIARDAIRPVEIIRDGAREREYALPPIDSSTAWLVVSESFDAGWRAFIRPADGAERDERALMVDQVAGSLIGVPVPASPSGTIVRLVYSPASFQIGLFASAIGVGIAALLVGVWGWGRVFGRLGEGGTARLARNSIAPILLNLFNRGVDMAFALVMLRLLGPTDAGWYFYAGVVFVWFDIFSNFGLNLYLTREVARDRSRARALFTTTSAIRAMLVAVGIPLLIALLAARAGISDPPLTGEVVLAIALLYVGLLPNSLSTGLTALFYAFERAETPAAVATISTIIKVTLGLAVLLAGMGFVGLAAVSIVTNIVALIILYAAGRDMLRGAVAPADRPSMRGGLAIMRGSAPLLFNHFLATIFFQIDVIILEVLRGAAVVGQYSVAYKWLTALNVIPAFFTQALLARMVAGARDDRERLRREVTLALRLLFTLAVPIALLFNTTAYFWAGFLGGSAYLPDGAIATQIMILSIPIGWLNSLSQYALIALDLQRRVTWAFLAAVIFNIVGNLMFIPQYGYQAAAVTTILSEGVLCIGFALLLRRGLNGVGIDWWGVVRVPLMAGGLMLAVLLSGYAAQPALTLIAACAVYAGTVIALGGFTRAEIARVVPGRLAARLGSG